MPSSSCSCAAFQLCSGGREPTFLLAPSPAPAGVLPAGKSWISAPLSTPTADHTLAAQAEGLAPALLLDEVAWGARSASSLGTQVVEAVPMACRFSVDQRRRGCDEARQRGIAAAIQGATRQPLKAARDRGVGERARLRREDRSGLARRRARHDVVATSSCRPYTGPCRPLPPRSATGLVPRGDPSSDGRLLTRAQDGGSQFYGDGWVGRDRSVDEEPHLGARLRARTVEGPGGDASQGPITAPVEATVSAP